MTNSEDTERDVDRLLDEAGGQWRARQTFGHVEVSPNAFEAARGGGRSLAAIVGAVGTVAVAAIVLAVFALSPQPKHPPGVGSDEVTASPPTTAIPAPTASAPPATATPTPMPNPATPTPAPTDNPASPTPTPATLTDATIDGLRWTRLYFGNDESSPMDGIRIGQRYFLSGLVFENGSLIDGWPGALWSSEDLVTWSREHVLLDLAGEPAAGGPVSRLALFGDRVIGAAPVGFCLMHCDSGWLSEQGSVILIGQESGPWERLDRPPGLEHGLVNAFAASDDLLVAVGTIDNLDRPEDGTETRAMAWTSRDGRTWEPVVGLPEAYGFYGVGYRDGAFVALLRSGFDQKATVIRSLDGSTWAPVLRKHDLDTFVSGSNGFLALESYGEGGRGWQSRDGEEWRRVTFTPPFDVFDIRWIGDRYLALGEAVTDSDEMGWDFSVWTSFDGATWVEHRFPDEIPDDGYPFLIALDGAGLIWAGQDESRGYWLIRPAD